MRLRLHNSEQFVLDSPRGAGSGKPFHSSLLRDERYSATDQSCLRSSGVKVFIPQRELCPKLCPNP
jgi:hypothetical protein